MTSILTNLFDGVAYGMLLFVLACGLAVTLGLMNFVNLAHGAFAMAGGYVCAVLVNQSGWPFFAALPLPLRRNFVERRLQACGRKYERLVRLCERGSYSRPQCKGGTKQQAQ